MTISDIYGISHRYSFAWLYRVRVITSSDPAKKILDIQTAVGSGLDKFNTIYEQTALRITFRINMDWKKLSSKNFYQNKIWVFRQT